MPDHIAINSFKFGLDTRRIELTSQPGTLVVGKNGFINQGAEFEKRKAFVQLSAVLVSSNTFGLEKVSSGMVVFGSDTTPVAFPLSLIGGTLAVAYQRLQHPAVLLGITYDGAKHAMTAIAHSASFNGKAFALATFADGASFAYYNGVLVNDFIAGLIMSGMDGAGATRKFIAKMLKNVTPSPYTATWTDPNLFLDLFGSEGVTYSAVQANTVASTGAIAITKQADQTSGSVATAAIGGFQIVAGVADASCYISSIKVGTDELLAGNVVWTATETTIALYATKVAAAINVGNVIYTAKAVGMTVLITAVATGTTPNNKNIVVKVNATQRNTNTGLCVGSCSFSLSAGSVNPTSYNVTANGVDISGTVNFNTDYATTASDMAKAINNKASPIVYTAYAVSNIVYVSQVTTSSADTNVDVRVTITGGTGNGVGPGGGASPLAASVTPTAVGPDHISNGNRYTTAATVNVSGGQPAYTYQWAMVSNPGGHVYIVSSTAVSTSFVAPYGVSRSAYNATAKCTVTDVAGTVVSSNIISIVV